MSLFIEARTDPFVDRREALAEDARRSNTQQTPVRRPLRGIESKGDSYAMMRVATRDGRFLPILDAAGDILTIRDGEAYTTTYSNFFLQTVTDPRQEKQQIVETFGDAYIFFYGESPRIMNLEGLLLNTTDFNWRAEWWENYERLFRGTRLVENGARLYLIFDDIIVEGYMMNCQSQENAMRREVLQISFQMFVTGYTNISNVGNPNFPIPQGMPDYSDMSSLGDILKDIDGSKNFGIPRGIETMRMTKLAMYIGSGILLADQLRKGLENNDPSVTGFMQRASVAIQGTARAQAEMAKLIARGIAQQLPKQGHKRMQPFRSRIRDNIDEFIGMPSTRVSNTGTGANQAAIRAAWTTIDNSVDAVMSNIINTSSTSFSDIMGRNGRADTEIRGSEVLTSSTMSAFQPSYFRQQRGAVLRDVPFGIGAFEEI
jgi:hypothetical protein